MPAYKSRIARTIQGANCAIFATFRRPASRVKGSGGAFQVEKAMRAMLEWQGHSPTAKKVSSGDFLGPKGHDSYAGVACAGGEAEESPPNLPLKREAHIGVGSPSMGNRQIPPPAGGGLAGRPTPIEPADPWHQSDRPDGSTTLPPRHRPPHGSPFPSSWLRSNTARRRPRPSGLP